MERYRKRQGRRKLRNQVIVIVLIIGVIGLVVYGASAFFQGCPDGVPQTTANTVLVAHYHVHLDVFVDRSPILVPDSLGHLASGNLCSLHTHDTTGLIHIETPSSQSFTISEVLDVWGYSVPSGALVYVNGALSDFSHVLVSHEEIAIVVGTPPASIPSSYNFPAGT